LIQQFRKQFKRFVETKGSTILLGEELPTNRRGSPPNVKNESGG
jgi:hypothetical protein